MQPIEMRRLRNKTVRTSSLAAAPVPRSSLNQRGMTIWFETIVDSAMEATITIDVADEKPPMKARVARKSWSLASGSVKTNKSGLDPSGSVDCPIMAIGNTNRLIKKRYRGKAQEAVDR